MKSLNIVEEARKFVKKECKKPDANYSTAYKHHFESTHRLAKELAKKMNADIEIVEIAAWLHDIGSVRFGRADHHLTSAKIAKDFLLERGYDKEKIEKIRKCILNHRGSKEEENKRDFIEAKIVANADAADAFEDVSKQFLICLVHENSSLEEAKKSIKKKLQNKWNQLSLKEAKKIIKPRYDAAMLLLNS